jgi:thiol:disulfide interchange protein
MSIRSGALISHCAFATLAAVLLTLAGCSDTGTPTSQPASTAQSAQPRIERGRLRFVPGFEQGLQQARREGKPVLLFFTAPWCGFCHQMAQEAFTHDQVVRLSEQFVCVLVDADQQPEVCREFRVRGYPTIQFLSPRGVPLNRVTGKKPGHQLVMEMQSALQAVARRTEWTERRVYQR